MILCGMGFRSTTSTRNMWGVFGSRLHKHVLGDLGGGVWLYSRTFGPKHDACVCQCNYVSFPYTVRLLCAIFSGQPWEYKRPSRLQINAQYQLSYLRLARFRTPDKSIQNVWRRGCCFGCWQWCVSLRTRTEDMCPTLSGLLGLNSHTLRITTTSDKEWISNYTCN